MKTQFSFSCSLGTRYMPTVQGLGLLTQAQFPLPFHDVNQGQIQAAEATLQQGQLEKQVAALQLESEFQQQMSAYQQALVALQQLCETLSPLAQTNLQLDQTTWETGKLPYLGLLDAQKTLISLQQQEAITNISRNWNT